METNPQAKFKENQSVVYYGFISRIEGSPQYKPQGNSPGWYYDLPRPDLKQIHESELERHSSFKDAPNFFQEDPDGL